MTKSITAKQMGHNSRAAQVKKYGSEEAYRTAMAKRSEAALEKRWGYKKEFDKKE